MSMYDDDLERRLRELRASGAPDPDPYDPYGRGPVRPGPPELTVGRLLGGLLFGLILPASVAGLVAYIVGGPWPAVWWGGGTFIVLFILSGVIGIRQMR